MRKSYTGVGSVSKAAPAILFTLLIVLQYSVGSYLWEYLPEAIGNITTSEKLALRQGRMMSVIIPLLTVFFTLAVIQNLNDEQKFNGFASAFITVLLFVFVSIIFWMKAVDLWLYETYGPKRLTPGASHSYDRVSVGAKYLLIEWSAVLSLLIQLNLMATLAGKVSNAPKAVRNTGGKVKGFLDSVKGKFKKTSKTTSRRPTPPASEENPFDRFKREQEEKIRTKDQDTRRGGAVNFDL